MLFKIFLDFAKFYQCFIQAFSKIAGPLILILRTTSTSLLTILQLLINVADEDEISDSGNETRILSTFFIFKKSTRVSYLISGTKKVFNHLWQTFIQVSIFQHFNPKRHI